MEAQPNTEPNNKKIKLDFKDSKYATGRRKKSVARVWLKKGSGNINVNGKTLVDYFKKQNLQMAIFRPLTIVKRENEFDVKCSVKGGGLTGQAGAIILERYRNKNLSFRKLKASSCFSMTVLFTFNCPRISRGKFIFF